MQTTWTSALTRSFPLMCSVLALVDLAVLVTALVDLADPAVLVMVPADLADPVVLVTALVVLVAPAVPVMVLAAPDGAALATVVPDGDVPCSSAWRRTCADCASSAAASISIRPEIRPSTSAIATDRVAAACKPAAASSKHKSRSV